MSNNMTRGLRIAALVICLVVPAVLTVSWVEGAEGRLEDMQAQATEPGAAAVATAAAADEGYCTPELRRILRRVLQSCGLLGSTGGRGCQPVEAKTVATLSGDDFNALFVPMKERGGIIQFDQAKAELDDQDMTLVDSIFTNQRGASYFFVVSRASPEGSVEFNRELSKQRAEAVMEHLRSRFQDPDLEREVGLLWLGEEYAQLASEFCDWKRSGGACTTDEINRSAFVAWIDCQL